MLTSQSLHPSQHHPLWIPKTTVLQSIPVIPDWLAAKHSVTKTPHRLKQPCSRFFLVCLHFYNPLKTSLPHQNRSTCTCTHARTHIQTDGRSRARVLQQIEIAPNPRVYLQPNVPEPDTVTHFLCPIWQTQLQRAHTMINRRKWRHHLQPLRVAAALQQAAMATGLEAG